MSRASLLFAVDDCIVLDCITCAGVGFQGRFSAANFPIGGKFSWFEVASNRKLISYALIRRDSWSLSVEYIGTVEGNFVGAVFLLNDANTCFNRLESCIRFKVSDFNFRAASRRRVGNFIRFERVIIADGSCRISGSAVLRFGKGAGSLNA